MSSTQPASLRDLYAPPSTSWSFAPPTNGSQVDIPSAPLPSYQWSARSSQSSILGLGSGYDDGGADMASLLRGAVTFVIGQYASTAVAVPWEIGKALLQVQWVPRDTQGPEEHESSEHTEEHNVDDGLSDTSADHESYFADPSAEDAACPPLRAVDEKGYVMRQSVTDDTVRQSYIIPVGCAAGASGMMVKLRHFHSEGWFSLWKGLFTTTVIEILSQSIQPALQSGLETILSPAISTPLGSYYPPPLVIPVASHVLTGFILSPLDLIRTRLMVQSADPRHRMYKGPLDAAEQILEQEGGLHGVYFHPHLFIPTILDCTLRAIVPFALPAFIASHLRITYETHPIARNAIELFGNCASLLVTLPFETVRRRLQVQTRGSARPFKGCVELRPAPYNGVVDAFWHILTEERSDLPLKPRRKHRRGSVNKGKSRHAQEKLEEDSESSWLRHSGVGQLYRGLSLRAGASVVMFILALFVGGDEPDSGWAEL
ncbi:mitochondrial carrier domain-containing protein [Irpex rosettiformis]|uniref:Mitochondrial carrier domain-containing protein n=1 Tax=Irpex rosettiformis TaxID=378272 RepID=A0ACB8UM53_9APHY|nr:mitochondrial carrier domain-containing protein [Irpex rosettiformis]